MTVFLALCVILFGTYVLIDLQDLRTENTLPNWLFLIFNTGMWAFAAHAWWERI